MAGDLLTDYTRCLWLRLWPVTTHGDYTWCLWPATAHGDYGR